MAGSSDSSGISVSKTIVLKKNILLLMLLLKGLAVVLAPGKVNE